MLPSVATYFRVQARAFCYAPLLGRPPGGDFIGALKRILLRLLQLATPSRYGRTGLFAAAAAAADGTPAAACVG